MLVHYIAKKNEQEKAYKMLSLGIGANNAETRKKLQEIAFGLPSEQVTKRVRKVVKATNAIQKVKASFNGKALAVSSKSIKDLYSKLK